MRVLFAVWPATAHLHPSVSLAWALKAAGHEVRVASTALIAKQIAAAGLSAVSIGDQERMLPPMGAGNPDLWAAADELSPLTEVLTSDDPADRYPWEHFRQFMLPCVWNFHPTDPAVALERSGLPDLVSFAKAWRPDLVIWDPCWPSAAVAAKASGAVHARLLWGHDMFAWTRDRWAERNSLPGVDLGPDPLERYVAPLADHYGVKVDDDLLLGDITIDPAPQGMRLPTHRSRVSMRWVPYNGADTVPEWLYGPAERPRIALCLGASMRQFGNGHEELMAAIHGLVGDMFEAVSELDVELVGTLNEAQLPKGKPIPDNVRTVEYIPLDQLLPSCSALIHHGGVGTWAAAVALSVPQIIPVEPWGIESPITGPYMAERGAGIAMNRAELSVEDIRKQIFDVVSNPSYLEGAKRVHHEWMSAPSTHDVVPLLEKLTAAHRNS
ncbi:nucleotide disphospho-sugar-binding domain-containing protein [Actinosynnema sp. NPDC049800]